MSSIISQNIKIAVDAVVFGYNSQQLQVLLIKIKSGLLKNKWALAGGFVKDNEGLTEAVHRELEEETGIKINYLEQLYTFGDDINRDPRQRVISVAHFALVNTSNLTPIAGTDAKDAKWFSIKNLPVLAYDHQKIIHVAHERLKSKLTYQPIGFDLLPETFLFSELENLYMNILETEIDRRNFRKKIMSFGFIEETEHIATKRSGRPAKVFQFNKMKYNYLLENGFHFEIKFA